MKKNKRWLQAAALTLAVTVAGTSFSQEIAWVQAKEQPAAAQEEADDQTIHLRSAEDLQAFTEGCISDAYSRNRRFVLDADIDLSGKALSSAAIFCGELDGCGHTIRGYRMKETGSDLGFIRFLEKDGVVRGLTLDGAIEPGGTGTHIGGLAGSNRGLIENCRFRGTIIGKEAVGGIAGYNEESGVIRGCTNEGKLLGTKRTGGIAGDNDGRIETCTNKGNINATAETVSEAEGEEATGMNLEISMSLSEMTADEERITSTGGIAGVNAGTLAQCVNHGTVGYPHVGYRTGGIVGYQRGCVDGCHNDGLVQGRRDTGGIAGFFEPYVEINYEEGTANQLRRQTDDLIDMLSDLSDITKDADQDTLDNMDAVGDSVDSIRDSLDGYRDDYRAKNDAFIDDMEEALDIVERRIDMLDFDVDGEELVRILQGIRSDVEAARKLLEGMSSLPSGTSVIYLGGGGGSAATMSVGEANPIPDETEETTGDSADPTDPDDPAASTDPSDPGDSEDDADDPDEEKDGSGGGGTESTGKESESTGKESESTGKESEGKKEEEKKEEEKKEEKKDEEEDSGGTLISRGGERSASWSVFIAEPESGTGSEITIPEEVLKQLEALGLTQEDLMKALADLGIDPKDIAGALTNAGEINKILRQAAENKVQELVQGMSNRGDALKEAARDIGDEGKNLIENTDKLGTEIRHVIHVAENHTKDIRDDLRETEDDLDGQIDDLESRIDALKDRLRGANDDVIAQMDLITDQMHRINDTASDGLDDLEEKLNDPDADKELSDYYDDLSDSEDTTQGKGKILNCLNEGEIISDINGGGIAGTLSVELLDSDSDFEVQETGSRNLDAQRSARGTIYGCKNNSEVTVKNDYAGGIVGRADLGAVIACQNYGDVETTDGDYAGGIAGSCGYLIRNSYALSNIYGNNYAGGIVGEGSDIRDNYAMTSILTDAGEKFGAIAGDADGRLSGNYFVEDGTAAVNGLTYESQAAPLTYEELIALESTPEDFQHFTIKFLADGEVLRTITCGYGDTLRESQIPLPPEKDGILGSWDRTDFSNIQRNMVVRAVYEDWETALSSGEAVPQVLISGQFLPTAALLCRALDPESVPQALGYDVLAAYQYEIQDDSLEGDTQLGVHILADVTKNANLRAYGGRKLRAAVVRDDKLQMIDGKIDGHYYVFAMTGGAEGTFVLLAQEAGTPTTLFGGAAVLVVLVLLLLNAARKKKKRGAGGAAQGAEEKTPQKRPEQKKKNAAQKGSAPRKSDAAREEPAAQEDSAPRKKPEQQKKSAPQEPDETAAQGNGEKAAAAGTEETPQEETKQEP